ncbi:MAG: hypothetical protein ABI670_13615 [Chloroflexota bacterium]
MITNLITPMVRNDEMLKGIRRSRFSFHFTTARRRRWLLVQLVTSPAIATEDLAEQPTAYTPAKPERASYSKLIDGYQSGRISQYCF